MRSDPARLPKKQTARLPFMCMTLAWPCRHGIKPLKMSMQEEEEEEDFTSSANQLGCTDVPGLSVTKVKGDVMHEGDVKAGSCRH